VLARSPPPSSISVGPFASVVLPQPSRVIYRTRANGVSYLQEILYTRGSNRRNKNYTHTNTCVRILRDPCEWALYKCTLFPGETTKNCRQRRNAHTHQLRHYTYTLFSILYCVLRHVYWNSLPPPLCCVDFKSRENNNLIFGQQWSKRVHHC